MKTTLKIVTVTIFLLMGSIAMAGAPPPPPPGGGGSGTGNVPGGGAALGGGLFILVALGAGYGAKKVFDARKKETLE